MKGVFYSIDTLPSNQTSTVTTNGRITTEFEIKHYPSNMPIYPSSRPSIITSGTTWYTSSRNVPIPFPSGKEKNEGSRKGFRTTIPRQDSFIRHIISKINRLHEHSIEIHEKLYYRECFVCMYAKKDKSDKQLFDRYLETDAYKQPYPTSFCDYSIHCGLHCK